MNGKCLPATSQLNQIYRNIFSFDKYLSQKLGFTALEMIVVILLVAVLSAMALFSANTSGLLNQKLKGTAQALAGDLRLTRSLAITNADGHRLQINQTTNEYRIFNSKGTQIGETRIIDSDITAEGDEAFTFTALGNASAGTSAVLSAGSERYIISVVPATGMITLAKQ